MRDRCDSAFILPYVLAVLAVMSIITMIAADRLQGSLQTLDRLREQNRTEQLFFSAESEAIYSLLTGITVDAGIDLNLNSLVRTEFGLIGENGEILADREADADVKPDIWSANQGVRISTQTTGDVFVTLQDLSGVVSLSNGSEGVLEDLLGSFGMSAEAARGLVAKLHDYSDSDNNRSFRGAERADYGFRDKLPPSNSPIRNYNELTSVLDWDKALSTWDVNKFKASTTILPSNPLRKAYMTAELLDLVDVKEVGDQSNVSGGDIFESLSALNPAPSDNLRLIFWVEKDNGLYNKRIIDVKRTTGNLYAPFKRYWVNDAVVKVNRTEFLPESIIEKENVIFPLSLQTRQQP